MPKTMITELLELLTAQATERLNTCASGIANELSESDDGTLTVGISLKLTRAADVLHCASTLAYSRKFKDEGEGQAHFEDPNQPGLGLEKESEETVTMTVPGKEPVTMTSKQFSKLVRQKVKKE